MLTISASDLRTWQSCRRRFLLERHWKLIRWRAHSLFNSCLRDAIYALSQAADLTATIGRARTRFLAEAARPGLDLVTGDPWTVANDWAGMLATVLTGLSRRRLLLLRKPSPVALPSSEPEMSWQPLSFQDDTGTLHRWATVDAWDDDALYRESHSWHTWGDMTMLDAPLELHVIEIGQQRNGRRHSPWARAYKHPVSNLHKLRFQRVEDKPGHRKQLEPGWKPFWYADQHQPDPEAWVDLMDKDEITPRLLHNISIAQPSATAASRCRAEILEVATEIGRALQSSPRPAGATAEETAMRTPMARAACDPVIGPCPWQAACWRDGSEWGVGALGLYQLRPAVPASASSSPETSVAGDGVPTSVGSIG